MRKFLYEVDYKNVHYDKISIDAAAELTGLSKAVLQKCNHQNLENVSGETFKRIKHTCKVRWLTADTETCYRVSNCDISEYRIWSYQIGTCEKYRNDFDILKGILQENKIRFYDYDTCFLFDSKFSFITAMQVFYNAGIRTLLFHNLKYDATWLSNVFENKLSEEHNEITYPHTEFILHNGRLYNGKLFLGTFDEKQKHNYLTFFDTFKTLASSLSNLCRDFNVDHGKIKVPPDFYSTYRPEGYKFTDLDLKYNSHDVIGLAEVIDKFESEILELCDIKILSLSKKDNHIRLRTAASIAYEAVKQTVKEYECINCPKKEGCELYIPTFGICSKNGNRTKCMRYMSAFDAHFTEHNIDSKEITSALKDFSKGKSIFLEYPQLENVLDSALIEQDRSTHYVNDYNTGLDALIAYSFEAYRGGVTFAVPENAGHIYKNLNTEKISYSSKNNYVYCKNAKADTLGWILDATSLYPSRERLEMPYIKSYCMTRKKLIQMFLQNPEKTTRDIYCLNYNVSSEILAEYKKSLEIWLLSEDKKEKSEIKHKIDHTYGVYYKQSFYEISQDDFNKKKCTFFRSGIKCPINDKYFIVKAKVKFDSPFYFYQVSTKNLTDEQKRDFNNMKGSHKKGIGYRQYQKDTFIADHLQTIEITIPLDELMFYEKMVTLYGGFFEYTIIDGVGCDIIKREKNPIALFINRLGEIKATAKGAKRSTVKLLLNSNYGKFGTKPYSLEKSLTDMIYQLEDKTIAEKREDNISDDFMYLSKKCNFVTLACAVTSHGRMHLFAPNINENFYTDLFFEPKTQKTGGLIQGQIENIIDYVDTDSFYVMNRKNFKDQNEMRQYLGLSGIGKELGEFKCEGEFVLFKTLGAKRKQIFEKTSYKNIFANVTTLAGCNHTLKINDFSTIGDFTSLKARIDKNTGVTILEESPFKITVKDLEIVHNEQILFRNGVLYIYE